MYQNILCFLYIPFVLKVLFCITLKGLNYFIDKKFNKQVQVLVQQRASTGAQTQYLPWALKLLGVLTTGYYVRTASTAPCSRDGNQKGRQKHMYLLPPSLTCRNLPADKDLQQLMYPAGTHSQNEGFNTSHHPLH